jgi:hypothetical protein
MTTRREFFKKAGMIGAGMATVGRAAGHAAPADVAKSPGPGKEGPDTLDLAEHGRLALGGILGSLNPALDYECAFLSLFDVHPAYMLHWSSMVSGVMPKYVEALPLLRLMCGSREGMDLQQGFIGAMLRNMADDGLVYDRVRPDRPWNTGVGYGKKGWDEDYANMAGNGRQLVGLTYWHQWTEDPKWKELARKTAERMLQLAIVRGEHAYYPNPGLGNDFSYPRKSGWTSTEPPQRANEGFEGATLFYLFQPLRGFAHYHALTGDPRFLEISRKFVNLGLQAKFWGADADMAASVGAQRAHFKGHFHGNLAALRGLLDYALVANDPRLKYFVRDGYEWARQHGIHRLGVFAHSGDGTEGCTIADMIGLAVALTDAGLGDYWDDVEQYARNGLIAAQATDKEEMVRVSQAGRHRPKDSNWGGAFDWRFGGNNKGVLKGQEITDRAIERSVGAFGHLHAARYLVPMLMHCCTANASQALYYAWEAVLRKQGNTAAVNLWLNRRSPWADVWSWLPHEGRLLVENKGMQRIAVRKPGWARQTAIRCRIDGSDAQPVWLGNHMLFDGLKGNERIQIEVPVAVEKCEYGLVNLNQRNLVTDQYACEFKGHTAVSVQALPRDGVAAHSWYRIFRCEKLRAAAALGKQVPPYVHPEKLVRWLAPKS